MKRIVCLFCLCLMLCGCGKETEPAEQAAMPTAPPETTTAVVSTEPAPTTQPTEAPAISTTQPPREPGPEEILGESAQIRDVSVTYTQELPRSFKSSSTYSVCGFREELELEEGQQYAVITFTIKNLTTGEMKIADIHDDFLVELIYDDHYVYSPDSGSWCVFQSGSKSALVSDMAGLGSLELAPLAEKTVQVYIPCAVEVSEETEKNLIVVFTSNYAGYENFTFTIR